MRKLVNYEWFVKIVQHMYKEMSSKVRVGHEYSNSFDALVGGHRGSVLSPLPFVVELEALSLEFHIGCPREILYTDDMMISAQSMGKFLVKMKTWKSELENKGEYG